MNNSTAPRDISVPSVETAPPVVRFNLRAAPEDAGRAGKALGFELPDRIGAGRRDGARAAWCLGPDEWLLHAPESDEDAVVAAGATLRDDCAHSLVRISDREVALLIAGPRAAELLSVGCPLDLRMMPVGDAKRTVFDSAQAVLIREAEDRFRLEVWRSFLPHVRELLEIAQREFASGF